jgi:hypothetical protein
MLTQKLEVNYDVRTSKETNKTHSNKNKRRQTVSFRQQLLNWGTATKMREGRHKHTHSIIILIMKYNCKYYNNIRTWNLICIQFLCRSQWTHGVRHELSSSARTLGSWVRIPLEAWVSVCVYSVCVVLYVGRGSATGWSPIQGVLPTVWNIVLCSGTGDAVRILTSFYYDFTSRHYNYFLQCALFTSALILYLGWSSDCWLLGCCSTRNPLISSWRCGSDRLLWSAPLIFSDFASLIGSFDLLLTLRLWSLLWFPLTLRLWSAPFDLPLTLHLWSAPLISSEVASLIGSFDLLLTRGKWVIGFTPWTLESLVPLEAEDPKGRSRSLFVVAGNAIWAAA